VIDLGDVKPGDFGEVTFDFALCDNPGYVWFVPTLRSASENGVTEPEADDPDEEETAPRPASEDGAGDDVELDEPTDLSLMDGLQWDGETVADGTTVRVGTGVAYEPFGVAPFGFEPVVTCVEAGTTVRWEWVDQTEVNPNIPNTVHHNVDIFQYGGDCTPIPESFVTSGHPVGYDSARGVDEPTPFTHTFDDPGIYPCYCEPHGPPESFPDPDPSTPENEALNDYHHPPGRPTEPPRDARGGDRHVLIGPLVPQTT
jgi:plastocyanin